MAGAPVAWARRAPSLRVSDYAGGFAYRPADTPEGGKPWPRGTAGPIEWSGGVSMRVLLSVAVVRGLKRPALVPPGGEPQGPGHPDEKILTRAARPINARAAPAVPALRY